MASLFVIQGADQGKRFEFTSSPVALGRDNSNAVRLHDTEVSRRHAELRLDRGGLSDRRPRLGQRDVRQRPAGRPDRCCTPATGSSSARRSCSFTRGTRGRSRDLTARVDLLAKSSPDDRSAILRSIPSGRGLARPARPRTPPAAGCANG